MKLNCFTAIFKTYRNILIFFIFTKVSVEIIQIQNKTDLKFNYTLSTKSNLFNFIHRIDNIVFSCTEERQKKRRTVGLKSKVKHETLARFVRNRSSTGRN